MNQENLYYKLLTNGTTIAVPYKEYLETDPLASFHLSDEIYRWPFKPVTVSTIFLGINHNFSGEGQPLLFETMVFGGPLDQTQLRCSTIKGAYVQHQGAVEIIRKVSFLSNCLYAIRNLFSKS